MNVKVLKLSNSKALWRTEHQNLFNYGEDKPNRAILRLAGGQNIKISSTMVEVNVLKLSNSKALWRTEYQNFFNHGEGKRIKTKQF